MQYCVANIHNFLVNLSSINKKTMQRIDYKQLIFLDGLRGLAALMVTLGHIKWLLWEGYSDGYLKHPETYSFINKIIMYSLSVFRFGHQSVMLFFILSGFVIHLRYSNQIANNSFQNFDTLNYLKRRAKRIYPPFIFALFLSFVLDTIGMNLGFSIYEGQTPNATINQSIHHINHEFLTFLGNVAFLFTSHVPIFGTVLPAWSLKLEWWFYIVYPLMLFINRKTVLGALGLVVLLQIYAFYFNITLPIFYVFNEIAGGLLSWWLGTTLADIYTKRLPIPMKYLSILTIFLLTILFGHKMPIYLQEYSNLFCAIGFVGLIALLLQLQSLNISLKFLEKFKLLGDFSYTLYIIHFPITVFISGWVLKNNNNQFPTTFEWFFAVSAICLVVSYLVHFMVEKPFLKK